MAFRSLILITVAAGTVLVAFLHAALVPSQNSTEQNDFLAAPTLSEARRLLVSGRVSEARCQFENIAESSSGQDRHVALLYAAVCDLAEGKWEDAACTVRGTLTSSRISDPCISRLLLGHKEIQNDTRLAALPGATSALMVVQTLSSTTQDDIKRAYGRVSEAKQDYRSRYDSRDYESKDPTVRRNYLASAIQYMSWCLLIGEQIVETRPDPHLYLRADEYFSDGLRIFESLSEELEKNDVVEGLFRYKPFVVAQYDAVRFRMKVIQAAFLQNEDRLSERVRNLQKITQSYSRLSSRLLLAHRDFHLRQTASAEKHLENAQDNVTDILDTLERAQGDYTLGSEPVFPDLEVPGTLPAFVPGFGDQLKLLRSALAYDAGSKLDGDEAIEQFTAASILADEVVRSAQPDEKSLAQVIQGRAEESIGLELVSADISDVAKHAMARPHFERARELLSAAQTALVRRGGDRAIRVALASTDSQIALMVAANLALLPDPPSESILRDIQKRSRELGSPEYFQSIARERANLQSPDVASRILLDGVKRHNDRQLWLEYFRFRYRGENKLAELVDLFSQCFPENPSSDAVFAYDDFEATCLKGMLGVFLVREKLGKDRDLVHFGTPGTDQVTIDAKHLKRLSHRDELSLPIADLERAIELIKEAKPQDAEVRLARGRSYLALAIAMQYFLNDEPAFNSTLSVDVTMAVAKSARTYLEATVPQDPESVELDDIANIEALIAACFAQGFLALQQEDEEFPATREAMYAFDAAIGLHASLPHDRTKIGVMGTPLVRLLQARPDMSGEAAGDRLARQAMEFFVDGAFAMTLGKPDGAVDRMTEGLHILEEGEAASGITADDALWLLRMESNAALRYLPQLLASYRVLTRLNSIDFETESVELQPDQIESYDAAVTQSLSEILSLIPEISDEDAQEASLDTIAAAVQEIPSPMVGFLLARAIEAKVVRHGLQGHPSRSELLEHARESLRVVEELLDDPGHRERFALFVRLRDDAYRRLSRPESFIEQSREFRKKLHLQDAKRVATAGLRRHPTSNALWKELFELGLVEARLINDAAARHTVYAGLLELVRLWDESVAVRQWDRLVTVAEIHDNLGEPATAVQLLEQALEYAENSNPKDEALVRSQLAGLRARIVIGNN